MTTEPLQIFLDNEKAVLAAYDESQGSPTKGLKILAEEVPGFKDMPLNTFKGIFRVFCAAARKQDSKRRISGWNLVTHKKDGYTRAHRRINGK